MTKKKITPQKNWFLEGVNRYDNASVYRAEVVPYLISEKRCDEILIKNKLSREDLELLQGEVSAWELAIKTLFFLCDLPLDYFREITVSKKLSYIVFSIPSKELGFQILNEAIKNIGSKFKKNISDSTSVISKALSRYHSSPILERYIFEAEKRNVPQIILSTFPVILQLGYGKKLKKVWSALTSKTTRIGAKLTANKYILNTLLNKLSIPVSQSKLIQDEGDLSLFLKEFTLPVVIKPADSTIGKGVSMNISNLQQAKRAYKIARKISSKVIIESQIEGAYYRLAFVNYQMVACAKSYPVKISGNGKSTLRKLIDQENKQPYRQSTDKNKSFYKIELTDKLKSLAASQGFKLSSVVPKDKAVFLSFSGADGGEWVEDNASVNPENTRLIQRALRFSELDVAGVDVISPDISIPLRKNGGKILEINAGPDTNIHSNVNRGEKIAIEKFIIDYLFPEKSGGRIPIISITGTNGKTTTSKLVAHILKDPKKWTVGLTTSEDKYINDELIDKGDKSGFLSARSLLMNPEIDVAVLETCHILGIDKRGLGYDWSDISIITNLTGDHVGTFCTRTEDDLFNIKAVIAKRTSKDGFLILNADDANVVKMAKLTQAKVAYFSLNFKNKHIQENIKSGLPVFYFEDDCLWEEYKKNKTCLAKVSEIPITFGGKASFNIYNCLGAIAAARLLFPKKITPEQITEKLKTFGLSVYSNPGRFNMIKKNGFKVILDYAHNPDGYSKAISLAKKIKHKRFVGVIKSAGDRPDDFIRELGKISAESFDYIYIKDPSQEKIRGRRKGIVCELLKTGVLETGFPEKNLEIIPKEDEAVKKALASAKKGDLILIFVHNIDHAIDLVKNHPA